MQSLLFFLFFFDDAFHHLVDSFDHVFGIVLESRLHAGIVEQLANYHACIFTLLLSVRIQFDDQRVRLVVLESYIPQLCSGLS